MSEPLKLRQTIVLHLDVMVSDECDDYLEVEITHPRLSGAMYLTVNDRREAEDTMSKIDVSEDDDEETGAKLKTYFSPPSQSVIALPASSSYQSSSSSVSASTSIKQIGPTKVSAAPVDSLVRNTVSLAGGLLDITASLRKLRKK